MSTVTKLRKQGENKNIKFRTLLMVTSIVLSCLFSMAYIGISIYNIKETTENSLKEKTQVEHKRFCDSISECAYQVEKIEAFVKRNGFTAIVRENLNLVSDDIAQKRMEILENKTKSLSISGKIVDSFIVVGKNANQKNLYVEVEEKKLTEENFPTADVLQESGLANILLSNWGNIGKADALQMQNVKLTGLNESERQATENMMKFVENQYFVCNYVEDLLVIVKFNGDYFQDRFIAGQEYAHIVYQSPKKPALYIGIDEELSARLLNKLSTDKEFWEDDSYYYNCTYNLYGNLSVVTVGERKNAVVKNTAVFQKARSVVFIVAAIVPIIAFLVTYFISRKIFERLNRLCQEIKKQAQMHNFTLIEIEDKTHGNRKITISKRIFWSMFSSCIVSLAVASIIFYSVIDKAVIECAYNFAESVSKQYQNQYEIYYERYNGLSTVEVEKLIEEFKGEDYQSNFDLIKEFEKNFYYEISFLSGYSYAFVVNQNKTVLYQTMLFSQTQISNNLVSQALTQAEKYDCSGAFVPVNDFLTGEEAIAFVKQLYVGDKFIGNLIVVLDSPSLPENYMEGMLQVHYLIMNEEHAVLIADKEYSEEQNLIFSEQDGLEECLGKCVAAIDYDFYAGQVRTSQIYSLIFMVVMWMLCFLGAFVLKPFLIRPFNLLMNHMHSAPKGMSGTMPESGTVDEISEITTAYNRMLLRLEEMVDMSIHQATLQKELELLQTQTEFKMLQSQINPHFLFNTLEIINLTSMNKKEEDVSRMIRSLSYILRYAIGKDAMVKVRSEIDALEAYIEIQSYRFGDSFSIELEMDKSLLQCHMIKFILQPLVENAILHGMKKTVQRGEIKVSLSCYEEGLEFRVSDNGIGMPMEKLNKLRESIYDSATEYAESKNGGIGLKNIYRRMKLYYGDRGKFIINSAEGSGTEIILRIPFDPEAELQ